MQVPSYSGKMAIILCIASVTGVAFPTFAQHAMPLHPAPWKVDGQPILGTYTSGPDKLDDLKRMRGAGMNVILGDKAELDITTPEGAYCRDNGIKVLYHLTQHIYHGVKLREPINASQTSIPLYVSRNLANSGPGVVEIDGELIRYDAIADNVLINCTRGYNNTPPVEHREGVILFWPEPCEKEIASVKDSPNLLGFYVLDDSPGDAVSALRGIYQLVRRADPGKQLPVVAGFGDAGSVVNFDVGMCDMMAIYWYPVSTRMYHRESTAMEVQRILTKARERVPGVPFVGIYQAFDGVPLQTGQGVPTQDQLREQLEDFVREGASGLIAYHGRGAGLPGWMDLPDLEATLKAAHNEIRTTGALAVRTETPSMREKRVQTEGYWETPRPVPGVVPAWHVLGPFEDVDQKGLDALLPPDTAIDLEATYQVKFGKARWRVRETTCGMMGLTNLYGASRELVNCVQYLYCTVTSPTEQAVQMRVCSDDDALIQLNAQEVYRYSGTRGLEYDKDVVPVTLPAGESTILVKVYNRGGMWGAFMRFTDSNGKPVENLRFSPQR